MHISIFPRDHCNIREATQYYQPQSDYFAIPYSPPDSYFSHLSGHSVDSPSPYDEDFATDSMENNGCNPSLPPEVYPITRSYDYLPVIREDDSEDDHCISSMIM